MARNNMFTAMKILMNLKSKPTIIYNGSPLKTQKGTMTYFNNTVALS
jgi:hypothetical protein